ncbi:MAG: cobalamin-dependent protein, partial [Candidatus Alcyoniella australis]|nr:cobalamin-dependent protein [Candidatus Alcyoniella australis]
MCALRVYLLHAPSVYDFRERTIMQGPVSDVVPSTQVFEMYPVGFTALSERLSTMGYDVHIKNLAFRMLASPQYDAEEAIRKLKQPFAIGIDLHWLPHCHGAIEIARLCRKHHPGVPIIFGGIAASYFHEELIGYDCVDYVVRGDSAEEPLGELMWNLEKGRPLDRVPNLTWIDQTGALRVNELSHVPAGVYDTSNNYLHMFSQSVAHLNIRDGIPFLDWFSYPITAIMTCRGCTQNCIICGGSRDGFRQYMGRDKIAMRPAEQLILDIRRIARYTSAPIFIVGDLRQGGESYARQVLEA